MEGKKAFIILASGGVYTLGAQTESYNVTISYLKQILGFTGITDVSVVLAGGTAAIDLGKTTMPELLGQFKPSVSQVAKALKLAFLARGAFPGTNQVG